MSHPPPKKKSVPANGKNISHSQTKEFETCPKPLSKKTRMDLTNIDLKNSTGTCCDEKFQPLTIDMT